MHHFFSGKSRKVLKSVVFKIGQKSSVNHETRNSDDSSHAQAKGAAISVSEA